MQGWVIQPQGPRRVTPKLLLDFVIMLNYESVFLPNSFKRKYTNIPGRRSDVDQQKNNTEFIYSRNYSTKIRTGLDVDLSK